MRPSTGSAVALLLFAAAACHRNRGEAVLEACVPVREASVRAADVTHLAGDHRVSFVVASGPRAGQTVTGHLVLQSQLDSLRRGPWSPAEQSAIGRFDLAPEDLGAVRMGDPSAIDPRQPGVGVYVSPASAGTLTVVARIGDLSNGRGEPAYDAGTFALFVREITPEGMRGAWSSGDGRQEIAAGHFCTRRQPA